MKSFTRFLYLTVFITILSLNLIVGQQAPDYPISYRLFTPFILNPAIAGSKDFTSVDLIIGKYGTSNSQLLSGNMRIAKTKKEYITSLPVTEFSKVGVGGYAFNDYNDTSRNIGFGATGSYHLQLDKNGISFLSFGLSAKGVLNKYPGNADLSKPAEDTFFPNVDAGIYYYNADFYAGLSATNILGNPSDPDSLGQYTIPVSRQFSLQAGYKFVLSRSLKILLEPFLIVNTDEEFSGEITDMLKPGFKLYAGNFCTGTYFNNFSKVSVMFQYQYSKVYIGTYFEIEYKEPFYKKPINAEVVLGINFSAIKSGFPRNYHW
jgi:type IX secretion system PorP/SprF family membrane protein